MKFRSNISSAICAIILIVVMLGNSYDYSMGKASNNLEETTKIIKTDPVKFTEDVEILYQYVADELKIPSKYVKIAHLVAGGKAIYADKYPNIFIDTTSEVMEPPFYIPGANTKYTRKSGAVCPDENVKRPNKYYMPDAAYNVTYEIMQLAKEREGYYKKNTNEYFESLGNDIQKDIVFYEGLVKYCGGTDEEVAKVIDTYMKIFNSKDKNEYVLYVNKQGKYKFMTKFTDIMEEYSDRTRNVLAIAMSFDGRLALSDLGENYQKQMIYNVNEKSRVNLILTSLSLIGNVRYVWGGGHRGASNINGVSPIWIAFNQLYSNNEDSCITPSNTWCPVHGSMGKSDNSCLGHDIQVTSLNDYIRVRKSMLSNSGKLLTYNELVGVLGETIVNPLEPHRLEGLDCSGYTAWVYNQIDSNRVYSGVALDFVSANGMKKLNAGSKLLPGDIVAWDKHIVMVIGKVTDSNRSYIIIEQAPNTVKLGVLVTGGVGTEELNYAKNIAKMYSMKVSNRSGNEYINTYYLDGIRYVYDEETEVETEVLSIGRLSSKFDDEDTLVANYGKTIKELTAEQILEHCINIRGNWNG